MKRFFLFVTAVIVLYWGGFVYDEIGLLVYAVGVTIIASIPALITVGFWKKIIFMLPLLILKVVGKILLSVFGKNALSKLLAKYGLLEKRFNKMLDSLQKNKSSAIDRWKRMRPSTQAYLILIFFPVAILIVLLILIIEFIRMRFVRFVIEKAMQAVFMKFTVNRKRPEAASTDVVETDKSENASAKTSAATSATKSATHTDQGGVEEQGEKKV